MYRRRIVALHKVFKGSNELSARERLEAGRRLRLAWACSGDPEQIAGVERLLAESQRIAMRRGMYGCGTPAGIP